jgi:hypothetical protein
LEGVVAAVSRSIQWLAIGFPALLVGLFEFFRHAWLEPAMSGFWGNLISAFIVGITIYSFMQYFVRCGRLR